MYYTYMIRCSDNSIYTGITTDINRRMEEHFSKGQKCAKYTLRNIANKLECVWQTENRVLASKLEYQIKNLTKMQKENLINGEKLSTYLSGKVDCRRYKRIKCG